MKNPKLPRNLAQAIADADIPAIAIPSNRRLGKKLAAATHIADADKTSLNARVVGPTTRTVTITVDDDGLDWRCTCSRKVTKPCKHVVAVAEYADPNGLSSG